MHNEKLAIVIPVCNEEAVIGHVLEKWYRQLSDLGMDFTIYVYNDGSRDRSAACIRETAEKHPERIIAGEKENSGHGPTILQGYRDAAAAGFDWIFQVDSDDEMGPESFHKLWKMRRDHDLIAGLRSARQQPFARKIVSAVSRLCVRLFYGKTISDVNVPYRLMRVSAFQSVFEQIPADTFAPNVIISGMAAVRKLRCCETPVPQHNRRTGEVSIKKWKLLRAAALSFIQTFSFSLENRRALWFFSVAAIFSLLAKLLMASRGYNFDFESYNIVANLIDQGKNVYAETHRYNYGPIWFYILWFLKTISGSLFRYSLPFFLGMADICIAGILWRLRYRPAALIFLLSPLGIQISGFHNQFDNFAVLIALISICFLMKREKNTTMGQVWAAAVVLGISITIKHIFIFFPLWLFCRDYCWKKRIVLLFVPVLIFLGSFIPYALEKNTAETFVEDVRFAQEQIKIFVQNDFWPEEQQKAEIRNHISKPHLKAGRGIAENVFLYKSHNNKIFYTFFLPGLFHCFSASFVFFCGMIACGCFYRKCPVFQQFLLYTAALVVFATATANQYLAIPLIFASVYFIPYGVAYHCIPGIFLLMFPGNTNCERVYIISIFLLLLLLLFHYRHYYRGTES